MALPLVPKSPPLTQASPSGPLVTVDGATIMTDTSDELTDQHFSDIVTDAAQVRAMVDVLNGRVTQLCQLRDAQAQFAERIRTLTINASKVA